MTNNSVCKNGRSCALCKNKDLVLKYKDVIENHSILSCKDCDIWVLDPIPADEDRNQIYQDDY